MPSCKCIMHEAIFHGLDQLAKLSGDLGASWPHVKGQRPYEEEHDLGCGPLHWSHRLCGLVYMDGEGACRARRYGRCKPYCRVSL